MIRKHSCLAAVTIHAGIRSGWWIFSRCSAGLAGWSGRRQPRPRRSTGGSGQRPRFAAVFSDDGTPRFVSHCLSPKSNSLDMPLRCQGWRNGSRKIHIGHDRVINIQARSLGLVLCVLTSRPKPALDQGTAGTRWVSRASGGLGSGSQPIAALDCPRHLPAARPEGGLAFKIFARRKGRSPRRGGGPSARVVFFRSTCRRQPQASGVCSAAARG